MDNTFKIWEANRKQYLNFFEGYTLEQLNKIPNGFSNNLIWNIGHIVVVQQGLVYRLSGLPMYVSDIMFESYKTGSKPTEKATAAEVAEIKLLLLSLIKRTKEDYSNGKFTNYNEYTTSTGFNLTSSNEALEFNNYHEALHLGFMMNIRKFV